VFENVAFPLRMRKRKLAEIDTAVRRILGIVGLETITDRKITALSGGQQQEALALSYRIAVMAVGKICQLATPDEIYEHPLSAFVASFVGDSNFFDVTLSQGGVAGGIVPSRSTLRHSRRLCRTGFRGLPP
jgi:ABC-type Fe3+/spermidine/putrescine transport system ATPase subunit